MTATAVYGRRWSPQDPATVLEYSAASHVGLVRSVNEDSFMAGPPVFVVADGMGGYEGGDLASTLVVGAFERLVGTVEVTASDLTACIARSRSEIEGLELTASSPGSTVIVAAYVVESGLGYWLIAHEGDSRAYFWKAGRLEQITRDHSVVQELVDAGEIDAEAARVHPERHVVTRAIGAHIRSEPEFTLIPVEPGTRLVLCSDGLNGELSEHAISLILAGAPTSRDAVDALVGAAVDAGGHDNVTVLVVDVVADEVDADTRGAGARITEDTIEIAREDS